MESRAQKRIYPELRIQQRQVFARILGALFALIGLGLVIGNVLLAFRMTRRGSSMPCLA